MHLHVSLECALTCITSTDGCSFTDYECLCSNPNFINQATICIHANCLGSDLTNAEASLQDNCKDVGVTLTTSATAPQSSHSQNVTSTLSSLGPGPIIIPDSKTTSSITTPPSSSSTIYPLGGIPSGATTTSEPGVPSGNSAARKSPVPVLVGVLSSVGVLTFVTATGICLLRRRRTRKEPIANQSFVVPHMMPYMLPYSSSRSGRSLERQLREDNLDPFKSEEDMNMRRESIPPVVKSNIGSRYEGLGEEAVEWMRQMSEIREEVSRLRQLLISSNQSDSNIPIPDQTAQLSEMREEMQRLRHLVSLQPAERRNVFDGVSRTTSLPAYED